MADYKEEYLHYCAELNNCTTTDEVKRHNAAMRRLGELFYLLEGVKDKSFLLELLRSECAKTRTLVAAHCLGFGVYIRKAKRVLSAVARSKDNPLLAFEAGSTLEVWKKQGCLKF